MRGIGKDILDFGLGGFIQTHRLAPAKKLINGAQDRNRTHNHRFTKAPLYHLSYPG